MYKDSFFWGILCGRKWLDADEQSVGPWMATASLIHNQKLTL